MSMWHFHKYNVIERGDSQFDPMAESGRGVASATIRGFKHGKVDPKRNPNILKP
jgi:hypothetical protein